MDRFDAGFGLFQFWPSGSEPPATLQLERSLGRRLKSAGLALIADRTGIVDPHYRGGYSIVSRSRIIEGRDFDLALPDVVAFVDGLKERKQQDAEGAALIA